MLEFRKKMDVKKVTVKKLKKNQQTRYESTHLVQEN